MLARIRRRKGRNLPFDPEQRGPVECLACMEKLIFKKFGTLKAFTDAVGITDSYWRRIRNGVRSPSHRTILAMSIALKVPAEAIFGEINKYKKKKK